jgi:hypothetical protein
VQRGASPLGVYRLCVQRSAAEATNFNAGETQRSTCGASRKAMVIGPVQASALYRDDVQAPAVPSQLPNSLRLS